MTVLFIDIVLVSCMMAVALMVATHRRLFSVVVMTGAYSFISAAMFVNLDAVDVAFTEAAVGAGFTTVLYLATMTCLPREERRGKSPIAMPLLVCILTGTLLLWAVVYLPPLGDAAAPVHSHVAPRYLTESDAVLHIPNVVTTVLASYRGFDTLGETIVIFTAGLGVLLILTGASLKSNKPNPKANPRRKP